MDGFVVVKDTPTDMVCMRLVSLKDEVHFWCFWNCISTTLASAFTNLSMVVAEGESSYSFCSDFVLSKLTEKKVLVGRRLILSLFRFIYYYR